MLASFTPSLMGNVIGAFMTSCVFCRIATGSAPTSLVYQDATILAFMDIRPVNPGHLLVIPRRHAAALADLDPAVCARLFSVGIALAAALRGASFRCEGINLFLADGEAAGQEVFHTHLHVIPRFTGDQFRITADWSRRPKRSELDGSAAAIRAVLERRDPNEVIPDLLDRSTSVTASMPVDVHQATPGKGGDR